MRHALTLAALLLLAPASALAQSRQMTVAEIEPIFQEASAATGVDVRLLRAVTWIESRFKPGAVSHKGARGLMQLMPGTAARFGVTDPHDPRQNVHAGARYLRYLLKMFDGDVSLALAGYNAGEGAVLKYGRRVPPYRETRGYVSSGLELLARSGLPLPHTPGPERRTSRPVTTPAPQVAAAAPPPPPTTSFVRRAANTPSDPADTAAVPAGPVSFVRRAPARLP